MTLANIVVKKTRDAVNLVSCRNVQMQECNFTGCGDDSLALKSDYALGRKIESANIYVWNCYFETATNALQIGAESVGDFRNINFWNVRIGRAWKAGIGMRSADGAIIDGVTYRDISMKQVDTPISITVGHRLLSGEVDRKVGAIKNVRISNLSVAGQRPRVAGVIRPSLIAGLPECPIENVMLEHVRIVGSGGYRRAGDSSAKGETGRRREAALVAAGFFITHARNVRMQDVDLSYNAVDPRPSLIAQEVAGLTLDDVRLQRFSNTPLIRLKKIDKLQIARCPGLADQTLEHVDATEK
ncbi:MAG TPA: glycosyl hydrolase family 28 protein [Chthoniobacterales bacterium]